MSYATERADGSTAEFSTELPTAARSLDQRVRLPLLIEEVERRGGKVVTRVVSTDDLEDLARDHDLVVVSTGRAGWRRCSRWTPSGRRTRRRSGSRH